MQIRKNYLKLVTISALLFSVISCSEKEEEATQLGKVEFFSKDLIEVESATLPLAINLGVDTYNHEGGKVHVEVMGGVYGVDYTLSTGSNSFDIDVKKGSQLASFSISPVSDFAVEGSMDLIFKITNVSGGLVLGDDDEFILTLLDDDDPTIGTVSFASTAFQVTEETTTDNIVTFLFDQPSTVGGTISIQASGNGVYGSDYTVQGQSTGSFMLTIPPLSNTAQFVVNSVDDAVLDFNKNVTFTITGVTGGLQFQSPSATTFTFTDGEVVPIPINETETFEGYTSGNTYLTATLGYAVQAIDATSGITSNFQANLNVGNYADVNNVTATSDKGVVLNHNASSPLNPALAGDLDRVLISPLKNGNGNVAFSVDCRYGFSSQNNSIVKFYWSETYTSGPFNLSDWNEIGSESVASMQGEGFTGSQFKRKVMNFSPNETFRIAIRVTQNINATNYRTQWRLDNFKFTN